VKTFWEKIPKKSFPAGLLQLIGYFDVDQEALIEKDGNFVIAKIDRNFKGEILIAPPANKQEQRDFDFSLRYLRGMQFALRKIEESENPEKYELWKKMILDTEVETYRRISALFDKLRMRILEMALNEFNSSRVMEKMMMMERIREISNE